MNVNELKEGREYYYTAGVEWIKVRYLYETINGYKFTANEVDNILTKQSVLLYIEEI